MKSAWPGEPTLSIPRLLMGLCGRRHHTYYKAKIFSFAGLLPVKVLMSIITAL